MFDKNKILIAGGGNIGSVVAVLLANKGFQVTILRRRPPFGNIIVKIFGVVEISEEIKIQNIKSTESSYDLIFITTQSQHTKALLDQLRTNQIVDEETTLISLQNGLESSQIICSYFPDNPVVQGIIWWSATLYDPTNILYHRKDKTIIGIPQCSKSKEALQRVNTVLSEILEVEISDEIEDEQHRKLILNVVSPILALVKQPYPEGLQNDLVKELVHRMFDDALNIAIELGWNVEDEKLINFHQILKGNKPVPKGISRNNFPHKVSTQIGLEKYGGISSNVHILLDTFDKRGSKIANRLISIVSSLDHDYIAFTDEQIQQLLNELPVPSCSLHSRN